MNRAAIACGAALLLVAVLLREPVERLTTKGVQGGVTDYRGPVLRRDDVPLAGPEDFVPTQEPLQCKKGPCTFGLLRLRGTALDGVTPVAFTLSTHLAGAVYKLTYGTTEFVKPVAIVGASMQTALIYDSPALNPTEAGCGDCDSFTARSSSQLLEVRRADRAVYTSTRAAYFNPPGKTLRFGAPTANDVVLSDTVINKRIEFVRPGVVEYTVGVVVPPQKYYFSLLEVLCVWCPRAACQTMDVLIDGAWTAMPDAADLYWIDLPNQPKCRGLAMSDAAGGRALGVRLLEWPRGAKWESPRYGTPDSDAAWRKWSITHRINATKDETYRIPGGAYTWKIQLVFGPLARVKAELAQ